MSQLVEMFNNSNKTRPAQAKEIPNRAVNFVDQQDTFQEEFALDRKPGDATTFTTKALEYYDEELSGMIIPPSFNRHDPDIPLNRYNPETKYYTPGQPAE